ncbi:MAG: DUF3794 domain-containing protein [Clostridia bacterium]|nr:DUF3794 domain-containing protein [Clostridia bacterium]
MSIKPQYETYRYTGEICRLQSQSMVECRLPGSEIGSVLAVQANATPIECTCRDGEVKYNGKLVLGIVYEDGERKICRAERGIEFIHKAEGGEVTPACFAKIAFKAENIGTRREGSGLYISVIVGAETIVYGSKQVEYLVGGDGLISQKGTAVVSKSVCVSGETESEDEFETDYVGDILLHSEKAIVNRVEANGGQLDIEGELNLHVCVLKTEDEICSYERLLPFRMQIPCEEAFGQISASARVQVRSANLLAGVDEEKGKSKILFTYTLLADCFLHTKEELPIAADVFSADTEITVKKQKGQGRYLTNQTRLVERVSGAAAFSPQLDGEYTLKGIALPRVEMTCKNGEAEGAVFAEVLLRSADGGYKCATLSLPFAFPVDVGEVSEADCLVCGLNVRRKKDGETEAEATLKAVARTYEDTEWAYLGEVTEGEAYAKNDAAISVYMPAEGEDLWQVAKRLRQTPEELQKCNPNLTFPVKAGERIFVYRQIK